MTDRTGPGNARTGVAHSREVAEFLGISETTLTGMRYQNLGPAYIRIPGGRSVRYRWEDVESWLDAGRVETDYSRRRA